MVKLVKWLFITALVLILLVILGVVIAASVIDPNDYKPLIIEQVKQQTGREMLIEGDLAWQLWPPIGISIGKTQLKNTPAFGGDDMLRFNQAVVDVQLLPLLSKAVVIDEVSIDGFYFQRITNKQGATNLDDLLTSEKKPTETEQTDSASMALQDIRIGEGVAITNALIIDENRATDSSQQLELKRFHIGQFAFDQWFDVGFELNAALSQPSLQANIVWQSQLQIDQEMKLIKLQEGRMTVDASGDAFLKPVSISLTTAVDVNLNEGTLAAKPLQVAIDDLKLTAPLTVTSLTTEPEVATVVNLQPFNARALLKDLGVDLVTADSKALSEVGMKAEIGFSVAKSLLSVAELNIDLDDTRITGNASVKTGDILTSRFNVAVDTLNLDRYLPPVNDSPSASDEIEAGPVDSGGQKTPPPDVGFLKTFDVEGKAKVGQLQASRVILDNISMDLLIRHGKLQVKPLVADIYQGAIRTDFVLNANPKVPEFQLQQSIDSVQVGPLLKALADSDILSGATEFSASIRGRSLDPQMIQETLHGKGRFLFKDGAVKGINVAQLIRDAQARLKGEAVSAEKDSKDIKKTDFSELNGSFSIVNGVINNPDFTAFSPLLRVRGNGDINLPQQQLDYRTKVSVVGSLKGQGGKSAGDLERVTIPLAITGAFADPKIKLDLEGAIKDKAKEKIKKEGKKLEDKAKQKLEEKAKEKLGSKLQDLFGAGKNDNNASEPTKPAAD